MTGVRWPSRNEFGEKLRIAIARERNLIAVLGEDGRRYVFKKFWIVEAGRP